MVAPLQNQLQQQQKQSPNSSEMEKKKAFPSSGDAPWSTPSASFLQRRILFHPAFKTSSSSAAPSLKPINSPLLNLPRACSSKQEGSPLPSELHSAPQKPQEPELLPSMPIRRIGAGLENLGNTCFLNSVLQCLSYTPPLTAYLQSGQHKSFCRISGFCALCALESHVKHALAVPGRVVSPTNFVKNLRSISRSFCVGRQEDAHEYMRYLIESLQKCSLPVASHNDQSHKMQNLIYKIFGGSLRSQVKCMHCSFCSNTYDPFLDLSLEIVRAESLQKALARFTAAEELDGDNKYRCSKCNMKVKSLKQFMVDKAPEILTIQFKRFSAIGGFGGKIDKKVQFDRTLDMRPYMSNLEVAPVSYSLYAVLVHSGNSTHSGHYYCFVRTATDMWHVLDDRRVSQVSEKTVLDQKAYILFYMRMPLFNPVPDLYKAPCKQVVHEEFVRQRPKLSNLVEAAKQNIFTIEPYLNGSTTQGSIEKSKESNGTTNEAVQLKSESKNVRIAKSKESKTNGQVGGVMQLKTQPAHASFDNLKTGSNNHIHSASEERKQLENAFIDQPKSINSNGHIGEVKGKSKNDNTLARSTSKRIEHLKPLCPADMAGSRSHKLYGVTVAAWDMDKFAGATRVIETLENEETRHCGHVLDDWEEEYDRGKRKKVRNRSIEIENQNMNGKNPFQALASTELHGVNHKGRMVKSQQVDRRLDNIKKGHNRDKHHHRKHKKLWNHSAKLQKRKTFQILAFRGLRHVISGKKKVKRQRTESSSSVNAKRRRSQS